MIIVARIWIAAVVRKGLAIAHKVLHIARGNCKSQRFTAAQTHIGDSNHLAARVEQRTAGIAGIDRAIHLYIGEAVKTALRGADHALRERALKTQRISNGEHGLSNIKLLIFLNGRE